MENENDDIQIDSESDLDDSVLAEEHQGDTIKKLKAKLSDAEDKAKEYLDELQRSKADFVNMRKRDEDSKLEFLKFAKTDVVSELIPVLDSLNIALAHGEKGVEPIYKQFIKILKDHGLEESDPLGETFDPMYHEAIGVIKTDKDEEDHKILEVMQKGYILSGKVIRPAKVRIGSKEN
ncbi:MAG: nucleotide exchange factor GrpE [Minisyncoccota bacterium]